MQFFRVFHSFVLLTSIIFLPTEADAQYGKRANHWYFGDHMYMDFSNGAPVLTKKGAINTFEGCATMSDENGNLQIYTDGATIWNRNHKVIPGATKLGGHASTTQSALILPKPGSKDTLYVFSLGAGESVHGLHYSVVDMKGNNGLGALISKRNFLLGDECQEQITAVPHCNRRDFWVIAQGANSTLFEWLLTPKGITLPPQKYKLAPFRFGGNLKTSFDGKMLASTGVDTVVLFSFDNQNGDISVIHSIPLPSNKKIKNIYYGLEFSPNSKILYSQSAIRSQLYQIDLSDLHPQKLEQSVLQLYQSDSAFFFGMQLGPDHKIYISDWAYENMHVINKPNEKGLSCDFIFDGPSITGSIPLGNLPNFTPLHIEDTTSYDIQVEVTDQNKCDGRAELEVIVTPSPPSATYQWMKGGRNGTPLSDKGSIISVSESGTYTVKVTLLTGCADSTSGLIAYKTVEVDIPEALKISDVSVTSSNCAQSTGEITIQVSGGTPGYTYSIDGGTTQMSNHFTMLAGGRHRIRIIDANGCPIDTTIVLPQTSPPRIGIVQKFDASCNEDNGAIELSATDGVPPYEFSNGGGLFTPSTVFDRLKPGSYTFYVRDMNGCKDSIEVEIKALSAPQIIDIQTTPDGCTDPMGTAVIHARSDSPPLMYSIGGGMFTSDSIFAMLKAGRYEIVVKDQNGCTAKSSFDIEQPNPPDIQIIDRTKATCNQNNATLTINGVGGSPPYRYSINGSSPSSSNTFTGLSAGTYRCSVIDAKGCRRDSSIEIGLIPPPSLTTADILPAYCGMQDGSVTLMGQWGTPPYLYSIDGINFTSDPVFSGLKAGTFRAYLKDANGCLDTLTVNIPDMEGVKIISTDTHPASCMKDNGQVTIRTSGRGSRVFSIDGSTFTPDSLFSGLAAGSYTAYVRDEHGCQDARSFTISSSGTSLTQSLDVNGATCGLDNGAVVIRTASDSLEYSLDGIHYTHTASFDSLEEGDYVLFVRDPSGCESRQAFTITGTLPLQIEQIETSASDCYEATGTATIQLSGGSGKRWVIPDGGMKQDLLLLHNLAPGTHTVTAEDEVGCRDSRTFEIDKEGCSFYVPNTFTPNRDGVNDVFKIYPYEGFKGEIRLFEVFDRWGNTVYRAQNFDADKSGWDGTFKGKKLNPGVFVYHIIVASQEQKTDSFSGTITLLR